MHTLSPKDDIMQFLYYQKKGPRFYTHKEVTPDNQLNDNKQHFPTESLTPS